MAIVAPDLLSVDEALAHVLERALPLESERVALAQSAGRYLAEPARAAVDLPPFASSAMDGYAVRAADTPGRLPVVFRIAAGAPAPGVLAAGEAMAIATGGAIPEGADAVVPHEYVVENENVVAVGDGVVRGANMRSRGGDVVAGEVVAEAGMRIGGGRLGALAAAGVAGLVCARRPRTAVLATGTEHRRPGGPPG